MLTGKLNYEKISKDYTGLETETAKTIVDNEKQTIKVNVKTIDELASLKDVSISNLQNDQILQYNKDHNIWINKDLEEESPESIKQKYESNPDTNAFTDIDKEKVDKLKIDGDGTKYLNDTGEYKIVEAGIEEAPQDDEIYGRKNKTWVTITGGGSGGIIMELGEGF